MSLKRLGRSLDFWQHNLNKGMSYKESLGPNQIVDINYIEFIKNPLDAIKHSVLGFDIDIETENKMEEYLINKIK